MGDRICVCGQVIHLSRQRGRKRKKCLSCSPIRVRHRRPKRQRPTITKVCLFCDLQFSTTHKNAKYCSEKCRQKFENRKRPKATCALCGGPTGYPANSKSTPNNPTCRSCLGRAEPVKRTGPCSKPGCDNDSKTGSQGLCRTHYQQSNAPCTKDGCDRPILGRGLCASHYSNWHRAQCKYTITCEACGAVAQVDRKRNKHCSYECGMNAVNARKAGMTVQEWLLRPKNESKIEKRVELKQCEWCLQLHNGNGKFCSDSCQLDRAKEKAAYKAKISRLMQFRIAFEVKDYETFFKELQFRVDIDSNGCWVWSGRVKSGGYPYLRWGNKTHQVHRLVLEAKHGKPLGSQHAHHVCANSSCVNPDHLQPVTHRENIAEMLQRQSYLSRIDELEEALANINPKHPLLNRIDVA